MRRRASAVGAFMFITAAVVAAIGSGGNAGAQPGPSLGVIDIPMGDPLTAGYYRLNTVTVTGNNAGINVQMSEGADTFQMVLAPRTGSTFPATPPTAPLAEVETRKTATTDSAQLDLTKGLLACQDPRGSFTLRDVAFGGGGAVTRLALEFTQRCFDNNATSGPLVSGLIYFQQPNGPLALPEVVPSEYYPMDPLRVLDTRTSAPLGPNGVVGIQVAGGSTGVPANATAVVVNITGVAPSIATFITAYPSGEGRPLVSNVNPNATDTVPNLATVKVGDGGGITLYNDVGTTDAVVDLMGYYLPDNNAVGGLRFSGLTPERRLDTRTDSTPFGPGEVRSVLIDPTGTPAAAAVLNVTVTSPTEGGFLTVFPDALGSPPVVSNLNFAATQTIPNQVIVRLDAGRAKIFNPVGSTHVVVDLVGVFRPAVNETNRVGDFVPITPARAYDSRTAVIGGLIGPDAVRDLGVVGLVGKFPFEYAGVVANTTVVDTTTDGYLTVYPTGGPTPFTSNLNWAPGEVRANLVTTGTDGFGFVSAYNAAGSANLIVDVAGLFVR